MSKYRNGFHGSEGLESEKRRADEDGRREGGHASITVLLSIISEQSQHFGLQAEGTVETRTRDLRTRTFNRAQWAGKKLFPHYDKS